MSIDVQLDNPAWAQVENLVGPGRYSWSRHMREVDYDRTGDRYAFTDTYAWTITAPDTVAFVVEHLGQAAIDPLAGSGYWTYLLRQASVNVLASDKAPAGSGIKNHWHNGTAWVGDIHTLDAVESVARAAKERTLLLSWPPYGEPIGTDVIAAYRGDRIVYIGEGEGGCCGDDDMFALLGKEWVEVAEHAPVQWMGMHDFITVYDRKDGAR